MTPLPKPSRPRASRTVLAVVIASVLAAGVWGAATGGSDKGPVERPGGAAGRGRPPGSCPDRPGCSGIGADRVRIGIHLTAGSCAARVPVQLPPGEAGPQDWVRYVNEVQGGVHGRVVEVNLADDGGCRDGAVAAVAELLEGDGAVAVGGLSGWHEAAGAGAEAAARGTPSAEPGGPQEWSSMPTFHQSAAGFDVLFPALLRYVIGPAGLNRPDARIGVLFDDVPEVAEPARRAPGQVPAASVVATIPVVDGEIDTRAALTRLQQTGADVVVCHCRPLSLIPFVEAADAAGYHPQYTFAGQGYDIDEVLAAFPTDSTFTANASGISAHCHPDHPCADTHRRALQEVAPGATITQRTIRLVHTLELLIEPLRRAGALVDQGSYAEALGSLDGWSTGLTGPVDLRPDRTVGVSAFAVYESPGRGATAWRMADAAGRAFNASWGA